MGTGNGENETRRKRREERKGQGYGKEMENGLLATLIKLFTVINSTFCSKQQQRSNCTIVTRGEGGGTN